MKYFFIFCVIVLCACGECDNSNYFQIKAKYSDSPNSPLCHFEAEGLGMCATWQKTERITFTDSCYFFQLSVVVSRAQLEKYK